MVIQGIISEKSSSYCEQAAMVPVTSSLWSVRETKVSSQTKKLGVSKANQVIEEVKRGTSS